MKGILLINLGSPKDLDDKSIKEFLIEFLSDDLVVDYPKIIQQTLVRGVIVPFRYKNTQAAYEEIWSTTGSPLIEMSKKVSRKLEKKISTPVEIGMRYQEPSIEHGLKSLIDRGCNKIKVIPLYPHYAISTTLTTKLKVEEVVRNLNCNLNIEYIDHFYNSRNYIKALSSSIRDYIKPETDLLLFSYHGIPKRHLKKATPERNHSDELCLKKQCAIKDFCYRHQVMETSRLCAEELNLSEDQWKVSFQSRVGPGWLQPFTDKELEKFPSLGIKNLTVACPSFVSDNLETLEEINMEARETFMDNGGKEFNYAPCLNDDESWIDFLASIS